MGLFSWFFDDPDDRPKRRRGGRRSAPKAKPARAPTGPKPVGPATAKWKRHHKKPRISTGRSDGEMTPDQLRRLMASGQLRIRRNPRRARRKARR